MRKDALALTVCFVGAVCWLFTSPARSGAG
jgi:hypothetical protein